MQTAPGTAQVDTKQSTPRVEIFLGLPDLRPDYVAAARELGAPIMVSASALAKPWTTEMRDADDPHPGFRAPPPGRLEGIRCALDSMGYTAMQRWGGYPFTPEAYAELPAKRVAARRVVSEVQRAPAPTPTAAPRAGDRTARRKVPFKTLHERARANELGMHPRAHLASELRQRLIKETLV